MDKEAVQLLNAVADKFGVAVEHLWLVLVRQARYEATIHLVLAILCWIGFVVAVRFVWRKTRTPPATEEERYPRPEWDDECQRIGVWAAIVGVCGLVIAPLSYYAATTSVTALCNPEYWALQQIFKLRQ